MCDLRFKCIFGVDDVEIISADGSNLIFKGFRYENLYLVDFNASEARLILMQDRYTVCVERTIGSEIVLDAPDGTPR